MPITQQQLSTRIKEALDARSNDPNVNTDEARQYLADELAAAFNDFVIGRTTNVTGTSATGGAVIATGIIQAT